MKFQELMGGGNHQGAAKISFCPPMQKGYFTRKTPSGISAGMSSNNATVRTIYSVNGKKQKELQRGVNIVRMSDGTIRKVIK